MNRIRLSIWIITYTLCSSMVLSQADQGSRDSIVNIPSSRMRLERRGGALLSVENLSDGRVVGYQLGCISFDKPKYAVLSYLEEHKISLAPAGKIRESHLWGSLHGSPIRCPSETRLSLIKVEFEDGGVWMLRATTASEVPEREKY